MTKMRHSTPSRIVHLLLAASMLAGCAQLTPRYERPAAPVPAEFPNAGAPGRGPAAADQPWQDFFTEPELRTLIELALRNNRDLRTAVLNIEAARAQYQLRRADQWPTVNAGVTSSRQTGGNGSNGSNDNVTGLYTAGLAVSAYELDLFGRVRSLSDAAAAQLLATEEARKAVQISLVASVATQYLALVADDELLDLTLRTLRTREESLKLTQLRFDNGVSSELDLRQAQTLVEAARVTLAQLRRQRELDRNALVLLVGQALPEWPVRPGRIDVMTLADVPAGLPSDVLLRRSDVVQAEQQLIAANANIGAARAAFWPRILLTGSVGTASTQLSDLFKNGAWSFATQLLQPIFDAGRNRANLAVAQVQRDIAVAQYERAIQTAFRDVADALAGRATLDEQLRATRAQVQAEQVRYSLSDLRFRNGVSSSLELLDAERSLFAAQQAVVQTQLALLQNRVSTYRALGGGNRGTAGP
jgi:outer membrane protein, multidrug efflux system